MKIKPEHLAALAAYVQPLDTEQTRECYRIGRFPRADTCKDRNLRYRWDLLYASGIKIGDGVGTKGDLDLYAYMDDTHIDTALRSIVPEL